MPLQDFFESGRVSIRVEISSKVMIARERKRLKGSEHFAFRGRRYKESEGDFALPLVLGLWALPETISRLLILLPPAHSRATVVL